MPGAQGPEVMAALIAHELNVKKHGLTMDFKHAFDTLDVDVMQKVFERLLPSTCSRWHSLLFEQWKTMKRWVVIDAGVHPQPLIVSQGLPQGDPGSCVVVATMMLALKKMVDEDIREDGQDVYQAIYMDDRTAIAKTESKLQELQMKWFEIAKEFHLIENPDNAQYVDMRETGSAFEILGTIIGNFQEQKQQDSRPIGRVKSIDMLYKKIGILPTRILGSLEDPS